MAETVKKAKTTAAKPRKTTSKKAPVTTPSADPVVENHHAETQERTAAARTNGHERQVSQEEVARLAHRYWQERGHKHGNHMEDWFRAERELRGNAS